VAEFYWLTKPDSPIRTLNDLKGKRIGFTNPQSTSQAMDYLLLEAAGLTTANVVKTTVFLTDLSDLQAMNAVYGTYFPAPYPARSTVQVTRLPRDVRIEIDAIADLGAATPTR